MKVQLLLAVAFLCACTNSDQIKKSTRQNQTSPEFEKGDSFFIKSERDSAFYYFNIVTENKKDSFLVAMAYAYMAIIQQDAGDFYGAQESALESVKLINPDSTRQYFTLASSYNVLGRGSLSLKNYDAAIKYFNLALHYQAYEDFDKVYYNNLAVAYREKKDYGEALRILQSIKSAPNEDKEAYARRVTNFASLRWRTDSSYNPLPDLHAALQTRIQIKDEIGVTASYNHLGDYYTSKNADSAIYYFESMFALAKKTGSSEDELDAVRKLSILVPTRKNVELFTRLSDSIYTAQNAAKNQFALVKYDYEKNRKENLLLQEDNAQKKLQIFRQRSWIYGSVILLFLIILGSYWWIRKKRQQSELKAKAAIRETQLKLSQKVHDTVANGLYRMMSEIEYNDNIEKEPLLDKIEQLYERSRDISYENILDETNTAGHINQLITPFANSNVKLSIVGNTTELWQNIPPDIVKELEQVLQELMVNMKKHSGAHHVIVHFSRSADTLSIQYKDDGRGLSSNMTKGNGLRSTETRIDQLGGQIIFTQNSGPGTIIKITVPINSQWSAKY